MEHKDHTNNSAGPGTLYLCATPIGNLEDITLRVLRTLKEADLIAAEDTRDSKKLLTHFQIETPMTSYHEYNRIEKAEWLADELMRGKNIALITDAGTPGSQIPEKIWYGSVPNAAFLSLHFREQRPVLRH